MFYETCRIRAVCEPPTIALTTHPQARGKEETNARTLPFVIYLRKIPRHGVPHGRKAILMHLFIPNAIHRTHQYYAPAIWRPRILASPINKSCHRSMPCEYFSSIIFMSTGGTDSSVARMVIRYIYQMC